MEYAMRRTAIERPYEALSELRLPPNKNRGKNKRVAKRQRPRHHFNPRKNVPPAENPPHHFTSKSARYPPDFWAGQGDLRHVNRVALNGFSSLRLGVGARLLASCRGLGRVRVGRAYGGKALSNQPNFYVLGDFRKGAHACSEIGVK